MTFNMKPVQIVFSFRSFSFAVLKELNHPFKTGFSKVPKNFGPEKPFVKLRPTYSVKLVFSHVVKGIKIKITAKFRTSRRLRCEDTKKIMSPEMRPKNFGTFEKRAPDHFLLLSVDRSNRNPNATH